NLGATVQRLVRRLGYEVYRIPKPSDTGYEVVRPVATYGPWGADEAFQRAYAGVAANTLVDRYRCYELWQLVEQCQKVEGAIVEVGVWRGGTGALIATRARQCGIADPVYLCDTFQGVVKAGRDDSEYKSGEHSDTSARTVEALLATLGVEGVQILQGVFPDQTAHLIPPGKIRLCHIDVDVYQSARDIAAWAWPRLAVGGLLVFDDYGFQSCDGITKFVNEQRPLPGRVVFHNLNGHGVVVKVAGG
ncbi:MAG: TylF/MycF/NovP-related O-methyltransferase, partial [Gemmataceae bacterium]